MAVGYLDSFMDASLEYSWSLIQWGDNWPEGKWEEMEEKLERYKRALAEMIEMVQTVVTGGYEYSTRSKRSRESSTVPPPPIPSGTYAP
ncbi:MAG: hypothetical protein LBJ92_02965 [Holosporales bacterium]|nr:hypothetical protein [Holosporales bacterium]